MTAYDDVSFYVSVSDLSRLFNLFPGERGACSMYRNVSSRDLQPNAASHPTWCQTQQTPLHHALDERPPFS